MSPDGGAAGEPPRRRSLAVAAAIALSLLAGSGEPAHAEPGAGPLRVCADPDNLPFSSAAPGERGLYVDLAELVAAKLGVATKYAWWYTFYGKRAVRNTLLADRCDAFFGLPDDADFMGQSLILTRPFLDVGWAIIGRPADLVVGPGAVPVSRVDDLRARRLAVVFRSTPQLLLAARGGFQTSTFRTDEEALDALARGEVDAAFTWGPTAGYYNLRKLGGSHRVVPVAGEGLQWRAAVAVRKGRDDLRQRIDRALAELRAEIRQLADRYGFPQGPAIAIAAGSPGPDAAAGARDRPAGARDTTGARDRPAGARAVAHPEVARTPPAPDPEAIAGGRSLFNQHCSHCHAPNAMSPEPSRDLRRLRLRYGTATSEVFFTTVTRGRPDKGMPPWTNLDRVSIERMWVFLDSVQTEP